MKKERCERWGEIKHEEDDPRNQMKGLKRVIRQGWKSESEDKYFRMGVDLFA